MTPDEQKPRPIRMGSPEDAKKSKPFRIFDFAWRRLPLVLGLGIPLFLVLRVLVTPFIHPIYKTEGTLLIRQSSEPTLNGRERQTIQGDVAVFQRTLVLRILDRDVIFAALENLPDEDRPDFLKGLGTSDRAVYSLISRLTAKEVERTYLIRVSLEAGDSNGLALTLHEVLSSLIRKLESEQEKQYASRLNYLKSEREKISQRGEEEKQRILNLANSLESRTMLREDYTTDLGKLNLVQKLYWEAQADTLAKAAALEEAIKNRDTLSKVSVAPFAQEKLSDNFGINQIERWTYEKAQDLRATIDGLTPENPDRKYVEERMKAMNEYMAEYKTRVTDQTITTMSQKRDFELESEVIRAENAFESVKQTSDQLARELENANEEATQISEGIFEATELTFGLSQLRDRLASINNRIDDVEMEAKAPLPVSIDQVPASPAKPASSNASKLQLAAFVLSFGLVGGLCLLFDFFDPRIRCRQDLAAAIGGPGAEPIPALTGSREDPGFGKILAGQPFHPASLAIRDLGLKLLFEHKRAGARVFGFVGSHSRSGNTTIALNVARSLSSHGLKVLVSEFPTPSPGLAAAAGLPGPGVALSPWGNRTNDPMSAVEILPWPDGQDLDRIRASLDAFLENARKAYDAILLDLTSFRFSDISQEAGLRSDVLVITTRQNLGNYGDVRFLVTAAQSAGVPALTAVLNFAEEEAIRTRAMSLVEESRRLATEWHKVFRRRTGAKAGELAGRIRGSKAWKNAGERVAGLRKGKQAPSGGDSTKTDTPSSPPPEDPKA